MLSVFFTVNSSIKSADNVAVSQLSKEYVMDKKNGKKLGHFELCLKEFKIGGIFTLAYIAVCCALSYFLGYGLDGTQTTFIMGIPSWAAIGVFLPWIIMVVITTVYGLFIMKGDDE